MLRSLVVLISALVIVNQSIFFSFMGLLDINYEGAGSSSIYTTYLLLLFSITIFLYFYTIIARGFLKGELSALAVIFFLVVIHLLWVLFDPMGTNLLPMFMIYSFVLGFVGLFSALAIVKLGLLNCLIKTAEPIFIVQATGIAAYSVLSTLSGNRVADLAGASYQALSYYSAFTMGMLVLYAFILPSKLRYGFTSSYIYRFLSFALIFLCALGVLIGAGRGAFLLMLAYFLYAGYVILFTSDKITKKVIIKIFTGGVVALGMLVVFLSFFWQQDFVQSGYKRVTAFISSDGIDLETGSSGRDRVYSIALDYIYEKPIIGYGPFGVRDKAIHAHNVFLELWLQFGVIILFLLPFTLSFFFKRLKTIDADCRIWIIFLLLYPIINIQFSSAYTTFSGLWFVLGLIFLSTSINRDIRHRTRS